MYYSVRYINNALHSVDIQKYNNNDIIYALEDTDQYEITYYYNLLFIDQWDNINVDNEVPSLYSNVTKIKLPDNSHIEVNDSSDFYLTGVGSISGHLDAMNLEGSSFTPPITYTKYLDIKSDVESEAIKLIKDFNKNNYLNTDHRTDFVYYYLNQQKVEKYMDETIRK